METRETKQEFKRWGWLFFFMYLVQKFTNNAEGISKIPVRKLLKQPAENGWFGDDTGASGTFNTNAMLGWYIKSLLGLVTDRIPLFGYRRKSWMLISLCITSAAWVWVILMGEPTQSSLFAALVIINLFVAFSDVVCDGMMVQTAQGLDRKHNLPEGTANRPLQASQWNGAFTAILISAVAGGIIAQLFNLKVAAIVSAILPALLAVAVVFIVKEEKVRFEWAQAKLGFVAIALTAVIGAEILLLKAVANPWEWLISPLLVLGGILSLYRPPMRLLAPVLLIAFWNFAPFSTDSQWMYQYFTVHNVDFLQALKDDTMLIPHLKDLAIVLKMADAATIAKDGFQEVFYGSIFSSFGLIFALVGLVVFKRRWNKVPMERVLLWSVGLRVLTTSLYLVMPEFGVTSPFYLLLCAALDGFTGAIVIISILSFAAGIAPKENQATSFAFLMGMANLGQSLGIEKLGGWIYGSVGNVATVVNGKTEQVMAQPHSAVIVVGIVSFAVLGALYALIRHLGNRGLLQGTANK